MASNDEIVDTRLAAVRKLATLPDGAFHPDGFAWAVAYRQDVTALRARLTTAETERDQWAQRASDREVELLRLNDGNDTIARLRLSEATLAAAEARVEAAKQALRDILDLLPSGEYSHAVAYIARAALACPPQQPQKAGE